MILNIIKRLIANQIKKLHDQIADQGYANDKQSTNYTKLNQALDLLNDRL